MQASQGQIMALAESGLGFEVQVLQPFGTRCRINGRIPDSGKLSGPWGWRTVDVFEDHEDVTPVLVVAVEQRDVWMPAPATTLVFKLNNATVETFNIALYRERVCECV